MNKKVLGKGLSSIFADLGNPVYDPETGNNVHDVPLEQIDPNPFQPRIEFEQEELSELAQSIKENGLLQPILLRRHQNRYQIIAGERRFRATQHLRLPRIKAFVKEKVSDRDMMELSLLENIQRVQLSPIEEADAYIKLIEVCGLTHETLAGRLNKSRSAITNTLRLLKLHPEVKIMLSKKELTAGHARTLLSMPEEKQLQTALQIRDNALNVRSAETIQQRSVAQAPKTTDANLTALANRLKYLSSTKVQIKGNGKKGWVQFQYLTADALDQLIQLLENGSASLQNKYNG